MFFNRFMLSLVLILSLSACSQEQEPLGHPIEPSTDRHIDEYLADIRGPGGLATYAHILLASGVLDEIRTGEQDTDPISEYVVFLPDDGWLQHLGISKEEFLQHPQVKDILKYNILRGFSYDLPRSRLMEFSTLLAGQSVTVGYDSRLEELQTINKTTKILLGHKDAPTTFEADVWWIDHLLIPPGITFK